MKCTAISLKHVYTNNANYKDVNIHIVIYTFIVIVLNVNWHLGGALVSRMSFKHESTTMLPMTSTHH